MNVPTRDRPEGDLGRSGELTERDPELSPELDDPEVTEALFKPPARRRGRVWVQVVSYLITVFALITLNFALPRLMPGDPIDALMTQGHTNYVDNERTRAKLEEYYHLDGSIPEQYGHYLKGLARGDLGTSTVTNLPVVPDLLDALPWTLLLLVTSTLVSVVIGLPAGVRSGWKRGKRTDRALMGLFMAFENVPVFVLATLAFFVFSVELGLFPLGGGMTLLSDYQGIEKIIDIARHLALPALVLGAVAASGHYLLMRSSMISELGADYLLLGRAKGLRDRRLKYRYAGRNALLPVVTGIGLQLALGIQGVVFVERIFTYPGVGGEIFTAISTRDYPMMQASFLLLTLGVVTVNLVVDLLYRRVDPRTAL